MTVVHDASGCNSTYATHDEPRWYGHASRTYISALTESDMILGNDERFVDNVVKAVSRVKPVPFIAVCGSPMPLMVGTDFTALAKEIEKRSKVPVLALRTNGMASYLKGVNEALVAFAERFVPENLPKSPRKVNILGATPLDFSVNGQVSSICSFLTEKGFEVNTVWSMDTTFEALQKTGEACVNLLVSSAALELARFFEKQFQTPFVAGIPMGRSFGKVCVNALHKAIETGESALPLFEREGSNEACIIGETVWASSLACALYAERGIAAKVLNPLETELAFLKEKDAAVPDEKSVEAAFAECRAVYGDPLYKAVAPAGVPFYGIPHEAFSGRCFRKNMKNLCGENFEKEFTIC
jgi:nitrogenase molybdenum-iron protein alpha/beta subunit